MTSWKKRAKKERTKKGKMGCPYFWNVSAIQYLQRLSLESSGGKPPFYATWGIIAIYTLTARPKV